MPENIALSVNDTALSAGLGKELGGRFHLLRAAIRGGQLHALLAPILEVP